MLAAAPDGQFRVTARFNEGIGLDVLTRCSVCFTVGVQLETSAAARPSTCRAAASTEAAPALATADLGVAMGRRGSDLTLQTADAVLVRDELATLPALLRLSRTARTAVVQNLVLATLAIIGLVTWDLLGTLPLPLGLLGHEGGTVLIGLNGLRLLRNSAWRQEPGHCRHRMPLAVLLASFRDPDAGQQPPTATSR